MYLSKVQLDGPATRNPYEWHRSLWQLFPNREASDRDFLFWVEKQRAGDGATILLQSEVEPIRRGSNIRLEASKAVSFGKLVNSQLLRFRLTANVIKTIKDAQNPDRSIRVPLLKEEEQLAWFSRKLLGAAHVEAATAASNPPLFFKRKGQAGKLVTVNFDGVLSVSDPNLMRELMKKGIGPAKAFGCGLLLIKPA